MAKKQPFSISPTPSYLYVTPKLKACLHKIRYTVDNKQGLTAVLGDVGMGKSTILRYLFAEYASKESECATNIITTPSYTSEFAFLKGVCECFQVPPKRSQLDQERVLREWLVEQYGLDKLVVIFIDEAQRLTNKMLELVRTLLNFETDTEKLIQIVLAGQLELRDRLLQDDNNKAIRRRLFAPSLLDPLSFSDMVAMIAFRCEQSEIHNPFTEAATKIVYEASNGVPGDILRICAISYDLMKQMETDTVTPEIVAVAEKEARLQ